MNKVIVITGATGATGRLAAQAFAARGDSLALFSREQAHLDVLTRDLNLPADRIHAQAVDLTDSSALRSAAEAASVKFGAIHILIHLVGGWTGGQALADSAPADLDLMLDQHVRTTFNLFQAFAPHLTRAGWGRVLTVSSPVASHPSAKLGAYAAAKSAQEALFLTLADELKGAGVTANVIQVRSIDVEHKGKGTPPEEIVAAMLYLCSEEAARINGAKFPLY